MRRRRRRQHPGEPLGERIIVTGRVLGLDGRPVAGQLVEIWQANAAGRYIHELDQHPAPLDPNFTGAGRCLTEPDGSYQVWIKPRGADTVEPSVLFLPRDGEATAVVPGADDAEAVLVTREPKSGSDTPSEDPVVTIPIT